MSVQEASTTAAEPIEQRASERPSFASLVASVTSR